MIQYVAFIDEVQTVQVGFVGTYPSVVASTTRRMGRPARDFVARAISQVLVDGFCGG
jgi:hypothetical protein